MFSFLFFMAHVFCHKGKEKTQSITCRTRTSHSANKRYISHWFHLSTTVYSLFIFGVDYMSPIDQAGLVCWDEFHNGLALTGPMSHIATKWNMMCLTDLRGSRHGLGTCNWLLML